MIENNETNPNIVFQDDSDEDLVAYNDISDKIFELRDKVSLDIISRNIIDRFNDPSIIETPNYVTKFKDLYYALKNDGLEDSDIKVLNNSFSELSELILTNLNAKFHVGVGDTLESGYVFDIDDYIDRIETLYEFFVVRRYSFIKDYFRMKLRQNKLSFVEKYKALLDDKTHDDLFLNQDKKKYKDISDVIIIHFINDIISDIREQATGAYQLFKEIVNNDLFEVFNNKMNELLILYGNDFVILDDSKAAKDYLSILDDDEIYVNLRNDILSMFLSDVSLNEKYLNE